MKYSIFLSTIAILFTLSSCEKEDSSSSQTGGSTLQVPSSYEYSDDNGNNTVSFNGQAQRLEMLSEMTSYMKTTNTSGVAISAQTLKDMYANAGYTWEDEDELEMTGSSKQLKNKTAAGSGGTADPAVQAYFEGQMDALAGISQGTTSGNDNGGPGQAGVVVSTTNNSKKYLQSAMGVEYTQYIEKGLMGAVFYNQIVMSYLGDGKMDVDNTSPVDPGNDKYYTVMEHHWDEAYGYFTTSIDYDPNESDSTRFWGKYAGGSREDILGSGTSIAEAFRRGRAAISANDLVERDNQRAVIREELAKVVAGTAIHYLNDAIENFSDDALRNHTLSEAVAFISGLPYGYEPIADQSQTTEWFILLGSDFYAVTTSDILNVRDQIASAAGLSEFKEEL